MSMSSYWAFLQASSPKPCKHLCSSPQVPHAPSVLHYEAPHAIFSPSPIASSLLGPQKLTQHPVLRHPELCPSFKRNHVSLERAVMYIELWTSGK